MDETNLSTGSDSDEPGQKRRAVRFSTAQKTCLTSYYCSGMTRTGKEHRELISKTAKDTNLKPDQVKVSSCM